MKDALGERMKEQYENRTRLMVPRRTYTVIRVDGKAFHTFTRGMAKPFDKKLMDTMDKTTIALCEAIQGVVLAYTQSDEISLILTDFATPQTDAWFDGNVQKMASVAASIATAAFNFHFQTPATSPKNLATFDARVFTIPDPIEVENYLIWRQQDAVRNSIQSAAQSVYSQKELHGKGTNELQELLFQRGINWNNYLSGEKRGRAVVKTKQTKTIFEGQPVVRNVWVALDGTDCNETPIFTADKLFLRTRIPHLGVANDSK